MTTKKNIYLVASEDSKVFGVGMTKRSFEERHKDGDWAKFHNYLKARGEKLVLVRWWEGKDTEDHPIHLYLKKIPSVKKFAEWFSHNTSIDIIENLITENFFCDDLKQPEKFIPRPYQQNFIDKIDRAYNKNKHSEFLLFAKCRAGKSSMVLNHIVDSNYKLSIICSRQNSPEQSWKEDAGRFFPTIKYISIKDRSWEVQLAHWMARDVNIVLWGTVQTIIKRLDKISNVDFIGFDEAHIGGTADQFLKVRDSLNNSTCYISGTAHKLSWLFPNEDQKFVYTYFDEQLDVQRGVFKRPKMNVAYAQYKTEEYQKVFGDDPDAMKNIFTMDGEKFLHESLVRDFIYKYFGPQREIRLDDRLIKGNHIMMALPSVAACYAFQKLVDCYYPALVVTGDSKKGQTDINIFLEHHKAKAIIITQSANVLGMTATKIDTVINCRGGKSIEFWTQLAFRGGSGEHDWWVIDFDAQRCLRAVNSAFQLACDNNPELSKHSTVEFINIHEWDDKFKMLSQESFEDAMSADVENSISTVTNIIESLDLSGLSNFNLKLNSSLTTVVKDVKMNEDNGANNKSCVVFETERVKKSDDIDTIKRKTVKALLESIPLSMLYIMRNGQNVNTIKDVINSEVYPSVTGDHEGILSEVVSLNPGCMELLTRRIGVVSHTIKKGMRDSVSNTINSLSVSSDIQQSIPTDLFDIMLEACEDLSNIYIYGDPSGSHTARLLEKGIEPKNITVWESCDAHRNRVKYISDEVNVVDTNPNMKFTAILANPPYNDPKNKAKNNKLWHAIVEQHLNLIVPGGDICEVTPASVLGVTGKGKKFLKLFSKEYNLKLIDYTANDYFREGVAICRWHLTNEPYQGNTVVITHDEVFDWDLTDGIPLRGDALLKSSILSKIANSSHPRIPLKMGQDIAKSEYVPDGKYEVYQSGNIIARTNVIPTTGEVLKFIVGYSRTYKKHKFISNGYVGMLNVWCPIASEEEGNDLSKIFDNKLIQFYIDNYKKTAGYTAAIKNAEVPHIKDYNNLVDQFNFTEEEVKYLEGRNVI